MTEEGIIIDENTPPEATPALTPQPAVPTMTTKATGEVFEVTKELYEQTYTEIDMLIREIDKVVLDRDFLAWLAYLTPEYITRKDNTAYLKELSERPALMSKNIKLRSIEDYFFYVIVPSRVKAELEKIIFIDNNHVKAYGTIFNQSGILYYLEKIDDQWKIGSK